jgi:hypothetical protein
MAPARLLSLMARRLGGVLLLIPASAGSISAQDEDTLLRAPAGPYRGTVINEKTGQPVPSAAVVILWQRLDDQIQGLRRLAAAQEAFTNEKGEFVHDVAATEGRLPSRTFAPRIIIFRPGYAPFPSKPSCSRRVSRRVDSLAPGARSGWSPSPTTRIARKPSTHSSRC